MDPVGRSTGAALVTGAAGGIGSAVVARLARELPVIATDLEAPNAEGAEASFALDVTDAGAWREVVDRVDREFQGVRVLANVAGQLVTGGAEQLSEEDWRRCWDANATGVYLGMRAVVPSMSQLDGGAIVNLSSVAGSVGYPSAFAYVAAKWAITGMSRAAALEFADRGIRVTSVHPGPVDTPMARNADLTEIPMGRKASPEEVADLVAFLASDSARSCTGSEYLIDGGMTAGLRR